MAKKCKDKGVLQMKGKQLTDFALPKKGKK